MRRSLANPYIYLALSGVAFCAALLRPDVGEGHGGLPSTAGWLALLAAMGALLIATHLGRHRDSTVIRLAWAVAITAVVLHGYVQAYHPTYGWTGLMAFGGFYQPSSLSALQDTPHYVLPGSPPSVGYDGQFYAQVALDPLLYDTAALNLALENPCYRARRILVPALAHVLGLGRPSPVLHAFALVHFGFFLLLLSSLLRRALLPSFSVRPALVLVACSMTAGVTTCLAGCLPDLAAAALIVSSLAAGPVGGPLAVAAAGLVRNTGLLGLVAHVRWPDNRAAFRRYAMTACAVIAPAVLWFVYAARRLTCDYPFGIGNIDWPLLGFVGRVQRAVQELPVDLLSQSGGVWQFARELAFHELLTILSIAVQIAFVLQRVAARRAGLGASPLERVGCVFALLGLCLGEVVWEGTGAAARVLMPLCIVFNLLLLQSRRSAFVPLWLLGNVYSVPALVRWISLQPPG